MTKLAILISLATILLGTAPDVALADEVPTFDIRATCHVGQADQSGDTVQACLVDEQSTRQSLAKEWAQYAQDDKTRCTRMVTNIAGLESYVELAICLRAAKAVKSLPKE